MMTWNTIEAQRKFSDLLNACHTEPQMLRERGKPVAVVLDIGLYEMLKAHGPRKLHLAPPKKRKTMAELMAELEVIRAEEPGEIEIPERVDRPNPFFEENE